MKTHLVFISIILGILISGSNAAVANDQSAAMTACKHHIAELYGDDLRMSLKKTRQRKGGVEVKMKVRTGGKTFIGKCLVEKDGKLTYSSNESE